MLIVDVEDEQKGAMTGVEERKNYLERQQGKGRGRERGVDSFCCCFFQNRYKMIP